MSHLSGESRASYVRAMFTKLAPDYDLLNRLMTFGRDRAWRAATIREIELAPDQWLLDIGAGTGDLAAEAILQQPDAIVIACDFTAEMVLYGRKNHAGSSILWVIGDAENLPFASENFHAVVSGFLLRNLGDLDRSLQEQSRVLRSGGRLAALETSPPRSGFLRPLVVGFYQYIVPALGRIFSSSPEAYQYLPDSTEAFLTPDQLAERFAKAGFIATRSTPRMMGAVAIHSGEKG